MRYAARVDANQVGTQSYRCVSCETFFKSYKKDRKYCSYACFNLQPKNKKILGRRCVCIVCNKEFRNLLGLTKYCDEHKDQAKINQIKEIKKGRRSNASKKLTKNCLFCNKIFEHYISRDKKYCSYDCHLKNDGAWKAGMAAAGARMRYGAKKDANHNEIVAALQQCGASVIDMSSVGGGFPDLIVGFNLQTLLVEIKNPKTSYGKKGLNKNQQKWKDKWIGGPYCVVDSVESALRAIGAIK